MQLATCKSHSGTHFLSFLSAARAGNGPAYGGITRAERCFDQSEASSGDRAPQHHHWLKKLAGSSCFQVTRLFALLFSSSVTSPSPPSPPIWAELCGTGGLCHEPF